MSKPTAWTRRWASARALVHPLEDSYIEVLVYFQAPGSELAARRVQWTPSGGYIELDIAPH